MATEDALKIRFYRTFYRVIRTAKSQGIHLPEKWDYRYTQLQSAYVEARMLQEKYNISIKTNAYLAEFLFKPLLKGKAESLINQLVAADSHEEKKP